MHELVLFKGIPVLFSDLRLTGIPPHLHKYEIRHEGFSPIQLGEHVLVNHWGTLISQNELVLEEDGFMSVCEEDFVFTDVSMSVEEYGQK